MGVDICSQYAVFSHVRSWLSLTLSFMLLNWRPISPPFSQGKTCGSPEVGLKSQHAQNLGKASLQKSCVIGICFQGKVYQQLTLAAIPQGCIRAVDFSRISRRKEVLAPKRPNSWGFQLKPSLYWNREAQGAQHSRIRKERSLDALGERGNGTQSCNVSEYPGVS